MAQNISVFLKASLRLENPKEYSLNDASAPPAAIEALINISSGLFIFAATAAKLVLDREKANPERHLAKLIGAIAPTDPSAYQPSGSSKRFLSCISGTI